MYHPEIVALDGIANGLYAEGRTKEATQCQLKAGAIQQKLVRPLCRRYVNAQWCWAYGHIGLLGMLIRWLRHTEPKTKLILETQGRVANEHFLKSLSPWIEIFNMLPNFLQREAEDNAIYFACPDGKLSIHNFYKQVERDCPRLPLEPIDVGGLLANLGVQEPFIALHARQFSHDPKRNVTQDMVYEAIDGYPNVVSIGLDEHPVSEQYPSVLTLPNPWLASFQLSAACDRFIGSNSGAWTVANAYGKPVELMNDHEHKAWIYPEAVDE